MRTTVTLDPDIAARLRKVASERGVSFKAAINAALRAGLDAPHRVGQPYREVTRDLGAQPGVDLVKALHLAGQLEDEAISHKLELRK